MRKRRIDPRPPVQTHTPYLLYVPNETWIKFKANCGKKITLRERIVELIEADIKK